MSTGIKISIDWVPKNKQAKLGFSLCKCWSISYYLYSLGNSPSGVPTENRRYLLESFMPGGRGTPIFLLQSCEIVRRSAQILRLSSANCESANVLKGKVACCQAHLLCFSSPWDLDPSSLCCLDAFRQNFEIFYSAFLVTVNRGDRIKLVYSMQKQKSLRVFFLTF